MKELIGDLFNPSTYMIMTPPTRGWVPANFTPDAICITTNGFVKNNGEAVMGRGCAKTAADRFPGLSSQLGSFINQYGNRVFDMSNIFPPPNPMNGPIRLVTFPVKGVSEPCNSVKSNVVKHMQNRFEPGQHVPGWACKARHVIIATSAMQLKDLADKRNWSSVVLPRPGCGAGELDWGTVRADLSQWLDDRFYCITFPRSK